MKETRRRKPLEELNAFDGFMFNELMNQEDREQAKDFCRTILEPIVNRKIGKIEVLSQHMLQGLDSEHHGIQMDAYVREYPDDDSQVEVLLEPAIYDIEPNDYVEASEEKRTRYYHALIDHHILESGEKYEKLERVFVIFILKYDPFGLDRMMYTIKRRCMEEPDMPYEDGDTTIFLYVYGKKDIPSQKLQNMLRYLVDSREENAKDEDLKRLSQMLKNVKANKRVGEQYMHTWMREQHIREEAKQEGMEEGLKEGHKAGLQEGAEQLLVQLICTKLNAGMDVPTIAKDLVQKEEYIEDLIEKYRLGN